MFIDLCNGNKLLDSIFVNFLNQLIDLHFNVLILLLFTNFLIINKNISIFNVLSLFLILCAYNNLDFIDIKMIFSNSYILNLNLINGLFLIHPILIYIFYSIIMYLIIYTHIYNKFFFIKKLICFYKIYLNKNLNKIYTLLVNVISLAIILGS